MMLEMERIFKDRLVNQKDRNTFYEILQPILNGNFKTEYTIESLMESNYIFGDFMNVVTRELDIIEEEKKLIKQIEEYMMDTTIDIELFRDAINHLCRCCRTLRQPRLLAQKIGNGQTIVIFSKIYIS